MYLLNYDRSILNSKSPQYSKYYLPAFGTASKRTHGTIEKRVALLAFSISNFQDCNFSSYQTPQVQLRKFGF